MVENWNIRLKECREKKGYTLKDLESISKLDMSQQSIIKYEKGEIFPRINILEKMCKIYGTTLEYILYGKHHMMQFEERSNTLVTIFMLLYTNKLLLDKKNNTLKINDRKLSSQISILNDFMTLSDISSIEDLYSLIEGINNLIKDK